jgi:hypothetical protein
MKGCLEQEEGVECDAARGFDVVSISINVQSIRSE